jgi:acetylglutamate kinase
MSKPFTSPPSALSSDAMGKALTLVEALPFMRRYSGATFVIKYGGHAMGDETLAMNFARDIVLLKHIGVNPVVVHGGGPQIGAMLDKLRIRSEFIDGLRVTDRDTVAVVEMVLAGSINKAIVSAIQAVGGKAIGLSGKDGGLLTAKRLVRTRRDPDSNIERVLDFGFVGEPDRVNPEVLTAFAHTDFIPVIAPTGMGPGGETYNVNADTAAGAIAGALGATRFFLLTDVPGVLAKERQLISDMTLEAARGYMADGTVSGGMIPKLETCIEAVERGVEGAVILDGRVPHILLLEVFTDRGAGTIVRR